MTRRTDIVISANALWNLVNFRRGLMEAMTARGYRVTAVAPGDGEARLPAGIDCEQVVIDRSGVNPLRDLRLLWSYYRILAKLRPAAFLGFTIKPNIYGALAARLAGVAGLPNVSGLGTVFINDGLFSRFVGRLYAAAFRKSAIVFFQNPDDRDLFLGRKIVTEKQARLLPGSGIDLDHFQPGKSPAGNRPTFLFIGRLLGDKGVREFAEAARILKGELPDVRFQLLGPVDEGNRTAIDRDELARWVADGVIDYLGESDDVRPYIRKATAIVLPSYREGLPRTLLEGAAMGRPLVASDVPGNREIALDGVTGLLCEARSATALADAMRRLAALPARRRTAMGRAGRKRVEEHFSEKRVIQIYLDALSELGLSPEPGVSMFDFGRTENRVPRGPAQSRAYVIGDVHGRIDLLNQLLSAIERDLAGLPPGKTMLVFLGDLIDRGPASREVVERLRTYRHKDVRLMVLAGNHEEVLLRILNGERGILDSWLTFGGSECLESYGVDPKRVRTMGEARGIEAVRKAIPESHRAFLSSFADTLRFGDYLFVHAGIRPGLDLSLQSQSDLRWIRSPFLEDESDHGFTVVHGHSIVDEVVERDNRIGIDTGAYRTGVLTALAIEDDRRWYLDTSGAATTVSPEKAGALI